MEGTKAEFQDQAETSCFAPIVHRLPQTGIQSACDAVKNVHKLKLLGKLKVEWE